MTMIAKVKLNIRNVKLNITMETTVLLACIRFVEALSSDEDEVDENNTSYLDSVKNFATKKASQMGLEMSAEIRASRLKRSIFSLILCVNVLFIYFEIFFFGSLETG